MDSKFWTVQRNMKGYYSDDPTDYGDPDIAYFLQELGVEMNEEKLKYYQLLEEFA